MLPADSLTTAAPAFVLVDAVQRLAMARDVHAIREIVRTVARQLTGADGATFVLRDGDQCHYVDEDAIGPLWKGRRFPISACVSGWVMLHRQPAVIPDIYADPRVPHDAYRPTFVRSLVMVPVRTLDPVGAIGNYWAAPHHATDEQVRLLQALADSTAVAMENVRVIAELEDRVRSRTAELEDTNLRLEETNADLRAAQEQADRVFAAYSGSLAGTTLDGRYRLDEPLGRGGFGVVFRGHHLTLDLPVAVKVFRPSPGNDSGRELQRFLSEGATTIRLTHPNVVRVLDSGLSDAGIAYLVMELLHGHTLGQEMADGTRLPVKRVAWVAAEVADALAAAHRGGVVHRDVKPDNVFVCSGAGGEAVKVLDFGIARLFGDASKADASRFTRTGGYVGTPAYVAPELTCGSETDDGRSDVFSLGVVLYRALTGAVPWDDTARTGTAGGPGWQPHRDIGEFRADVPPPLETVIIRALARDPRQRPTAEELAATLRTIAAGMGGA